MYQSAPFCSRPFQPVTKNVGPALARGLDRSCHAVPRRLLVLLAALVLVLVLVLKPKVVRRIAAARPG